jgi:hypothetical protein
MPTATDVRVKTASWLAPTLLALLLEIDPSAAAPNRWRVRAGDDGDAAELRARWLTCRIGGGGPADSHWVLTVAVPPAVRTSLAGLLLGDNKQSASLAMSAIEEKLTGAAGFAAACGDLLDMTGRGQAASFLAVAPGAYAIEFTPELCEALNGIRDVLRPSLPASTVGPDAAAAIRLGEVIELDERAFLLSGWLHAAAPGAARLTAIAPEGTRAAPRTGAVTFHPRPDLEGKFGDTIHPVGFSAYVELDSPSRHPTGWLVELRTAAGDAVQTAANNPVATDIGRVRRLLHLEPLTPVDESSLANQFLPALTRLASSAASGVIEEVVDYGTVPDSPSVSIVVATAATDRIEHQIVEFALDPEIGGVEIIYAIPHEADSQLDSLAAGLSALHRLPFRIARVSPAALRARAVNLGASIARGRLLVLLSGDTIPTAPGWLNAMRTFHDANPSAGAVGPMLLHADGSIVDAGSTYLPDRQPHRWRRASPLRGLAPTLLAATETRAVQAVSDACVMVTSDRFRALGGVSELYLENGDEAGDFCLGLADAGAETWYLPDARLHVLERDAWPGRPTATTDAYNAWLFNNRWGARLTEAARDRA